MLNLLGRCPGAEGRPALGERVDALSAAERAAVVPVGPEIKASVEAGIGGAAQLLGQGAVVAGSPVVQLFQQLGKTQRAAGDEPAQPHALAADAIKPVVPVAAAHERKPVGAEAALLRHGQGPYRVLKHRGAILALPRRLVAVALVIAQRGRLNEACLHGAEGEIAGGLRVFAQRPDKPQQIVRAAGTHALVACRVSVPPVHHISLGVLVTAAVEDL